MTRHSKGAMTTMPDQPVSILGGRGIEDQRGEAEKHVSPRSTRDRFLCVFPTLDLKRTDGRARSAPALPDRSGLGRQLVEAIGERQGQDGATAGDGASWSVRRIAA